VDFQRQEIIDERIEVARLKAQVENSLLSIRPALNEALDSISLIEKARSLFKNI
jgi:hypothetical protein